MKEISQQLASKQSRLIIEEGNNKNTVIGVPHHAPVGVPKLPCFKDRPSDENAGHLGHYIANRLDSYCIIACNYTIDVNKSLDNDYARQLIQWSPNLLVEIHGHHRARTKNDVEISCGSIEGNKYSLSLAGNLRDKCQKKVELNWLKICGDFSKIFFQAKRVKTITCSDWLGFLIELPPELRFKKGQKGGEPPQIGYTFCDYLVESLEEMGEI